MSELANGRAVSGGGLGQPAGSPAGSVSTMAQVVDILSGLGDRVSRREFSAPEVFTVGTGRTIENFFREFEDYATQRFGPSEAGWLPHLEQYLAEPLCDLC